MHKKIIVALLTIGFSALNGASGIRPASQFSLGPSPTTNVQPYDYSRSTIMLYNTTDIPLHIIGYAILAPHTSIVFTVPSGNNLDFLLNSILTSGRLLVPLAPTTANDTILHLNRIIFSPTENQDIISVTMETFNNLPTWDDSESADDEEEVITESTDDEAPLPQANVLTWDDSESADEEEGLSEDTDDDESIAGGTAAAA